VLWRVHDQVRATFRPRPAVGVLPCTVRFVGANVLEGLRELIPRGATTGRLPVFLSSLPERLTTHLIVTDADMVPAA
jgi:hypothetical protein